MRWGQKRLIIIHLKRRYRQVGQESQCWRKINQETIKKESMEILLHQIIMLIQLALLYIIITTILTTITLINLRNHLTVIYMHIELKILDVPMSSGAVMNRIIPPPGGIVLRPSSSSGKRPQPSSNNVTITKSFHHMR